jgi:hypothetical protein
MHFTRSSRRASSRPRRRSENPVGQEANVAVDDDGRNAGIIPPTDSTTSDLGLLEEHLQINPFPFGDFVSQTFL